MASTAIMTVWGAKGNQLTIEEVRLPAPLCLGRQT